MTDSLGHLTPFILCPDDRAQNSKTRVLLFEGSLEMKYFIVFYFQFLRQGLAIEPRLASELNTS